MVATCLVGIGMASYSDQDKKLKENTTLAELERNTEKDQNNLSYKIMKSCRYDTKSKEK